MKAFNSLTCHLRPLLSVLALVVGLSTLSGVSRATEISVVQVAPLSGVLASTGQQMVLGAKVLVEGQRRAGPAPTRARLVKALESMGNFDLDGTSVQYSPSNRFGSRYVEVTVIGGAGKLLR